MHAATTINDGVVLPRDLIGRRAVHCHLTGAL